MTRGYAGAIALVPATIAREAKPSHFGAEI